MPLQVLLYLFNVYGHQNKLIRDDLIECVFAGMMKENTPYEEILRHYPINLEENVRGEQQMCDKLNEFLKESQQYLHFPIENETIPLGQELLTPKTIVDLKSFALLIGWFCLFYMFASFSPDFSIKKKLFPTKINPSLVILPPELNSIKF